VAGLSLLASNPVSSGFLSAGLCFLARTKKPNAISTVMGVTTCHSAERWWQCARELLLIGTEVRVVAVAKAMYDAAVRAVVGAWLVWHHHQNVSANHDEIHTSEFSYGCSAI
jgi:hypothetical protein